MIPGFNPYYNFTSFKKTNYYIGLLEQSNLNILLLKNLQTVCFYVNARENLRLQNYNC